MHVQDYESLANFILGIQRQLQQLSDENAALKDQLNKIIAAQKELNQGK